VSRDTLAVRLASVAAAPAITAVAGATARAVAPVALLPVTM